MPLDQVDVDQLDKNKEEEMSFLDHLEALRWHLIRGIAAIMVFAIVIFLLEKIVFENIILAHTNKDFITYRLFCSLSEMLCFYPKDLTLMTISLEEQFITHLKVSFFLGIIIAFPYIFWEMWRFIKPGLYPEEKNAARGIVFVCSALFLFGVLFGYFVIAPFAVTYLSNYAIVEVIESTVTLSKYVSVITMLTLPVGLVFELPVVVYFLSRVGLITPAFMKSYRRHAIIVILILASIITPPDVITQFLIGIPLYILYEASITISKRVNDAREKDLKS